MELSRIVLRHCQFYYRLSARAEALAWPVGDPVYRRIIHARDALSALRTFIADIGKNVPAPPNTPGIVHYLDDPNTAPRGRRARQI